MNRLRYWLAPRMIRLGWKMAGAKNMSVAQIFIPGRGVINL